MLAAKILQYLGHLQDVDYLAAIVNSTPSAELCNTINILLQSEDDETVNLTCLFIRDLLLFGNRHPDCKEFIEKYPQSSIVKTLEGLVFSTNHFICEQAIYTLGKTCSYDSANILSQAFAKLRDIDPLVLPRLLGELGWLGAENFWELLDLMMSSPVYVTRWAVIAVLHEFNSDDELLERKRRYVAQLRQDINIHVRLEAEYEYQLLRFRSEGHELSRAERKKKRKDLERQYKPALCFACVVSAFTNYLYTQGLMQYSVDELETFIIDMAQAG
ncbi:HEAT repeat domain-containing protein [Oculatella sp. LEGE 06141]|uniref:HEAT repeat domain-containing protein n=1 Tax=Oculatella sp. LEGE 06141 TaxID=1828648 RepID=UPI00187EDB5A|nr:HEAT repeat domain-containing protein [Oculatella sp. LEGE 06141]MBE9182763.1 HEAT repeat domain-containing protein [Oculatella sp. LEGE 06141]